MNFSKSRVSPQPCDISDNSRNTFPQVHLVNVNARPHPGVVSAHPRFSRHSFTRPATVQTFIPKHQASKFQTQSCNHGNRCFYPGCKYAHTIVEQLIGCANYQLETGQPFDKPVYLQWPEYQCRLCQNPRCNKTICPDAHTQLEKQLALIRFARLSGSKFIEFVEVCCRRCDDIMCEKKDCLMAHSRDEQVQGQLEFSKVRGFQYAVPVHVDWPVGECDCVDRNYKREQCKLDHCKTDTCVFAHSLKEMLWYRRHVRMAKDQAKLSALQRLRLCAYST
jgi:hypothetical protein